MTASLLNDYNPLTDEMVQVLSPEGEVVRPELMPNWSNEQIKEAYATMVFLRMADTKISKLQRQGRCGTYASIEGQEACQIGSGLMLDKKDWVFPAFRELGISYVHGMPLDTFLVYWMGNEWGSNHSACVAPPSIPVGSHMLHAAGYAWAMKMQKKSHITISYFGDGATSEGDFYEALNFAGVFKIPTILFCQNNQWAISIPRSRQTAAKTLAQKAIAAGIPGIQVDGMDLFAVAAVTKFAVERARNGEGATLIEAVAYRFGNHTTSDEAKKYRDPAEIEQWRPRDPMIRLQKYLEKKGLWTAAWEEELQAAAEPKIAEAVEKAENHPVQTPAEIFDYMFETLPPALVEQKTYLQSFYPEAH